MKRMKIVLALKIIRTIILNLFPPTLKTYRSFPTASVAGNTFLISSKADQSLSLHNKYHLSTASADFGYFSPSNNGKLTYTSLKSLLPEKNKVFTEVWETIAYGNDIFFMSRDFIFQLSNNVINVYPAVNEWLFLGKSNSQLIAQDSENGLLEFKNGLWMPFVKENIFPKGFIVSTLFPFGEDSTFITTINSGFFILSGNKTAKFEFKNWCAGENYFC